MWLYHLIKESLVACFILQALYAGASVTKFDDLSSYFTISLICLVPEVVALILAIVMTIGGDGKRISIGQMIVDLVFEVLFIGFAAIAFTTVAEGDLPFPQAIEGLFFLFAACTVFFIILSIKAISAPSFKACSRFSTARRSTLKTSTSTTSKTCSRSRASTLSRTLTTATTKSSTRTRLLPRLRPRTRTRVSSRRATA